MATNDPSITIKIKSTFDGGGVAQAKTELQTLGTGSGLQELTQSFQTASQEAETFGTQIGSAGKSGIKILRDTDKQTGKTTNALGGLTDGVKQLTAGWGKMLMGMLGLSSGIGIITTLITLAKTAYDAITEQDRLAAEARKQHDQDVYNNAEKLSKQAQTAREQQDRDYNTGIILRGEEKITAQYAEQTNQARRRLAIEQDIIDTKAGTFDAQEQEKRFDIEADYEQDITDGVDKSQAAKKRDAALAALRKQSNQRRRQLEQERIQAEINAAQEEERLLLAHYTDLENQLNVRASKGISETAITRLEKQLKDMLESVAKKSDVLSALRKQMDAALEEAREAAEDYYKNPNARNEQKYNKKDSSYKQIKEKFELYLGAYEEDKTAYEVLASKKREIQNLLESTTGMPVQSIDEMIEAVKKWNEFTDQLENKRDSTAQALDEKTKDTFRITEQKHNMDGRHAAEERRDQAEERRDQAAQARADQEEEQRREQEKLTRQSQEATDAIASLNRTMEQAGEASSKAVKGIDKQLNNINDGSLGNLGKTIADGAHAAAKDGQITAQELDQLQTLQQQANQVQGTNGQQLRTMLDRLIAIGSENIRLQNEAAEAQKAYQARVKKLEDDQRTLREKVRLNLH